MAVSALEAKMGRRTSDYATFAKAVAYDPRTGVFTWLVESGKAHVGALAGSVGNHGYLAIGYRGKKVLAHRLAWWFATGQDADGFVDHINCNRLDNRLENLRVVGRRVNNENLRAAKSNNKTGLLGVTYCKQTGRYRALIRSNGIKYFLGRHATPEEAHSEYLNAKREMHEGCTL